MHHRSCLPSWVATHRTPPVLLDAGTRNQHFVAFFFQGPKLNISNLLFPLRTGALWRKGCRALRKDQLLHQQPSIWWYVVQHITTPESLVIHFSNAPVRSWSRCRRRFGSFWWHGSIAAFANDGHANGRRRYLKGEEEWEWQICTTHMQGWHTIFPPSTYICWCLIGAGRQASAAPATPAPTPASAAPVSFATSPLYTILDLAVDISFSNLLLFECRPPQRHSKWAFQERSYRTSFRAWVWLLYRPPRQ